MEPYQRLETEFGRWAGVENVVGCSSGTAALHLAFETLGLPKGARVALPDWTMIACARAVTMADLRPVFVDIDPKTLTMCPDALERALEKDRGQNRVQAILAVATHGRAVQPAIYDLAEKWGAFVVEDLAEAHGIPPHPNAVAACWSFYKNKIIAGEEGGAVAFKRYGAMEHAKMLRSLGFTEDHDYTHIPRGHNYRLSNVHASLILNSLDAYTEHLAERHRMESLYITHTPEEWRLPNRTAPWVYDIRIPEMKEGTQWKIVRELQQYGWPARFGFKPLSNQQEYRTIPTPLNTESWIASKEVITLPLTPYFRKEGVESDVVRRVFQVIKYWVDEAKG